MQLNLASPAVKASHDYSALLAANVASYIRHPTSLSRRCQEMRRNLAISQSFDDARQVVSARPSGFTRTLIMAVH